MNEIDFTEDYYTILNIKIKFIHCINYNFLELFDK